jgi:Leucine-rich repeat (LRR) protein
MLEELRVVNLERTGLEGLPERFGEIKALSRLLCSNNCLRSLPGSFGKLELLMEVDLSNSKLRIEGFVVWAR